MPRYEHDNWGDIANHLFMKGIITSVDSENDTADVTVPGGNNGADVPIFYHCSDDAEERSNGAIEGGSAAFSEDDEVIVMCEVSGTPVRIIGFVDGIKPCYDQQYLVVGSAVSQWRTIFVVWDVVADTVAEISWDGDDITFPYNAPFMLMDIPAAPPFPAYVEANGVPGAYEDDPLYLWMNSRKWDRGTTEEDRLGIPVASMRNGLNFGEDNADLEQPDYAAGCSASCNWTGDPATHQPTDSCDYSKMDTVDARGNFSAQLALQNTGTQSGHAECEIDQSVPNINYVYGLQQDLIELSYAAAPKATNDVDEVTNRMENHTPFVAATVQKRTGEYHSGLRQSIEHNTTYVSESEYTFDQTAPGVPGTCSGLLSTTSTDDYVFHFHTPLGELESISISGGYTFTCTTLIHPVPSSSCIFTDGAFAQTLYLPVWTGLEAISIPKNMYHCKFNDTTLFQIYYYSTKIKSYNRSGTTALSQVNLLPKTVVKEDTVTSCRASVAYFPDRDAEDADPTEMVSHTDLESAIDAVLIAAADFDPDGIIYNMTAKLFN